jgi:hypothetical protein
MAFPRIVWDGKNLDFPHEVSSLERRRKSEREIEFSASGRAGSVFEHAFDEILIEMDVFSDRAFYRAAQTWWAWAAQGLEYAFALDSDDMVDAALDGAAASGQKIIPLASTAGISAGKFYRLRSADLTREEIIEVDSISAGVSVTAVDDLLYSYDSGDTLRSEDYWPSVVSDDDEFPIEETDFGNFEMKHKFREVY